MLGETLGPLGFEFEFREEGKSSGGDYAWASLSVEIGVWNFTFVAIWD